MISWSFQMGFYGKHMAHFIFMLLPRNTFSHSRYLQDAIKTLKTVKYSFSKLRSVRDKKPKFCLTVTFYLMHYKIILNQLKDHSTNFLGNKDNDQQKTTEQNNDTNN